MGNGLETSRESNNHRPAVRQFTTEESNPTGKSVQAARDSVVGAASGAVPSGSFEGNTILFKAAHGDDTERLRGQEHQSQEARQRKKEEPKEHKKKIEINPKWWHTEPYDGKKPFLDREPERHEPALQPSAPSSTAFEIDLQKGSILADPHKTSRELPDGKGTEYTDSRGNKYTDFKDQSQRIVIKTPTGLQTSETHPDGSWSFAEARGSSILMESGKQDGSAKSRKITNDETTEAEWGPGGEFRNQTTINRHNGYGKSFTPTPDGYVKEGPAMKL